MGDSMLTKLWELQIQIFPVVCSLIICELPGIIRNLKKLYYVPIYFSMFPLRELNRDLSIYLGEDYFYGEGSGLSDTKLDALRKRILLTSLISLAASVIVTPAIAGFMSAFFLRSIDFAGFCILFIAYKLIGLVRAAMGFKTHAVSNAKTMTWFWLIYIVYFGCFLTVFESTYDWASPFVNTSDWIGLWKAFRGVIFLKIVVSGFIVALIGTAATSIFTDRKLRTQIRDRYK